MITADSLPTLTIEQPSILTFNESRRKLQATAPVCRIRTPAGDVGWLVTRHAEAKALLMDARLGRTHPDSANAPRYLRNPVLDLLIIDTPPEVEHRLHKQQRIIYNGSFAGRQVLSHRPQVQITADAILDAIEDAGPPADLHADFAMPFSQTALCDMIGIPADRRRELLKMIEGVGDADNEQIAKAQMDALHESATQLCVRKRNEPCNDVISQFAEVGLSDEELGLHTVTMLFSALSSVTSHLDFGILLLASHPDQRELAMRDPQSMVLAVEEVLRTVVGSPVLPRYASEDIEIGGVTMRLGDLVLIDFSLVNYDPRVFVEPDRFDVTRSPNPHLAFGHGIRHCMGAPMARILLGTAFTTLFSRLPGLRLAIPKDELRPHPGSRLAGGIAELPFTW